MKKQILFLISVVGLLVLAACGGATPEAEPAVESGAAPAQEVETTAEEAVVEAETETEMAEAESSEMEVVDAEEAETAEMDTVMEAVEAEEADMAESVEMEETEVEVASADTAAIVNPTDFAQIGETGRPQFFNSFATW